VPNQRSDNSAPIGAINGINSGIGVGEHALS
jgi:hypothetical protein